MGISEAIITPIQEFISLYRFELLAIAGIIGVIFYVVTNKLKLEEQLR